MAVFSLKSVILTAWPAIRNVRAPLPHTESEAAYIWSDQAVVASVGADGLLLRWRISILVRAAQESVGS